MTYMINKNTILITLFLSGCAFIDYTSLPSVAKSIVFGAKDINITQEFFDSQKYSFVKVRIGKHSIAIFVLSRIDDDKFYWIASNGARLTTLRDGRPIKLTSESYNFQIIPVSNHINIFETQTPYEYFISLKDPKAFIAQEAILLDAGSSDIDYLDGKISVDITEEKIKSLSMNWDYVNRYYRNNSGLGIRSELYFNPLAEKLELNFYYKF